MANSTTSQHISRWPGDDGAIPLRLLAATAIVKVTPRAKRALHHGKASDRRPTSPIASLFSRGTKHASTTLSTGLSTVRRARVGLTKGSAAYTGHEDDRHRRATIGKDERLEAKIEAQLREWAAELESLKAKTDKAAAEARKNYYEQVDELREEIEAKLRAWSKALEGSQATAESAEAAAKTLVERLHGAIQTQLRDLRPLIEDLRGRAEQAEKEAKRLVKEWRAKREPAQAALGDLKVGVEKAWGELRNALDSAITKFREPS